MPELTAAAWIAALSFFYLWWNECERRKLACRDRDFWYDMYRKECVHAHKIFSEALQATEPKS